MLHPIVGNLWLKLTVLCSTATKQSGQKTALADARTDVNSCHVDASPTTETSTYFNAPIDEISGGVIATQGCGS